MKVDLDELRSLGRDRNEGVRVQTSTLRALVAVVDAARKAWCAPGPERTAALFAALEPFTPAADRAWEEVDRWNAERDLAVKAAVDAAKPNPRDRARDQLADAGGTVQRQFRSDQERIAELEAERDEWKGRHKAVTNGLPSHVARADQAEEALRELVAALDDAGPGAMWVVVGEEREQHIRAVLDGAKP